MSTKNPRAGCPLFDVSISLPGATSRYPWAGELEGEGDGDGDAPEGEAVGAGVPRPAGGRTLVAPAGAAG